MAGTARSATVVIPTHNRAAELDETLAVLARLDPAPDEIIVVLDACTDHSEAVVARYPSVQVVRTSERQGSIPTRDTAFRMARGDLIVSLDDDSAPEETDFLAQLYALADAHPEAGAFAFREVRDGVGPRGLDKRAYVAAYPNCAGAIRRAIYGTVTAYPRFFSHAYAEPDFCLQVYDAGYKVLNEPSIRVRHRFTSSLRSMRARHQRNARNEFWSVVMRCPFPHLLWVAPYRVARQFVFAANQGWILDEPRWWLSALRHIGKPLAARAPVPWSVYWAWMRLARRPMPAPLPAARATTALDRATPSAAAAAPIHL